ncbi:MAG: hypothetical protein HZC15_05510 [Candidatus Omnitrophica bacterium]|nr:hypothetical protein [Candidatus Omnitrophota bacterium]
MANLDFYNINHIKAESGNQVVVKGEVANRSGKNYSAIAIRVILFIKNIPVGNVVVVVNGLPNGITKCFEKQVEELDFEAVGNSITRYEVYVESAY